MVAPRDLTPLVNRLSARELAALLADLSDRVETLERKGQLGRSSFTTGAIKVIKDGTVAAQFGVQADGTFGAQTLDGPTPPQPAAPTLSQIPNGLLVEWTGAWADPAANTPLDLKQVDIVVSDDPDDDFVHLPPSQMFVSGGGGRVAVMWGTSNVPLYVRLIARSTAGKSSLPSAAASETPGTEWVGGYAAITVTETGPQTIVLAHDPMDRESTHVYWNGVEQMDVLDWDLNGRLVTFPDTQGWVKVGNRLEVKYLYAPGVEPSVLPLAIPVFVGADAQTSTGNPTVTIPANVRIGDLLLAGVISSQDNGVLVTPDGWQEITAVDSQHKVFMRIADGADAGRAQTFADTVSNMFASRTIAILLAYRKASVYAVNSTFGQFGIEQYARTPVYTMPSDGGMVVAFFMETNISGPGLSNPVAPMVTRINAPAARGSGAGADVAVGAGPTGQYTAGNSGPGVTAVTMSIALVGVTYE